MCANGKPKTPKKPKMASKPVDVPHPSSGYRDAWDGYLEVRQSKKYPMTARAIGLLVGKLGKMTESDGIEALDAATVGAWKSVYPPAKSETEEERIKAQQRKKQRIQEAQRMSEEDRMRMQTLDGKSVAEMFRKRHSLQ